jgi:hypothetical protein
MVALPIPPDGRWTADPFGYHDACWHDGDTWTHWIADDGIVLVDSSSRYPTTGRPPHLSPPPPPPRTYNDRWVALTSARSAIVSEQKQRSDRTWRADELAAVDADFERLEAGPRPKFTATQSFSDGYGLYCTPPHPSTLRCDGLDVHSGECDRPADVLVDICHSLGDATYACCAAHVAYMVQRGRSIVRLHGVFVDDHWIIPAHDWTGPGDLARYGNFTLAEREIELAGCESGDPAQHLAAMVIEQFPQTAYPPPCEHASRDITPGLYSCWETTLAIVHKTMPTPFG